MLNNPISSTVFFNPIKGLDRPWGFQEDKAPIFQDSRHMKVVRLSALRTGRFHPRKYAWYSFLLEAESTPRAIVRPEGLCQWKIRITPSGIETATFRLVVQCLNQLGQCMPQHRNVRDSILPRHRHGHFKSRGLWLFSRQNYLRF